MYRIRFGLVGIWGAFNLDSNHGQIRSFLADQTWTNSFWLNWSGWVRRRVRFIYWLGYHTSRTFYSKIPPLMDFHLFSFCLQPVTYAFLPHQVANQSICKQDISNVFSFHGDMATDSSSSFLHLALHLSIFFPSCSSIVYAQFIWRNRQVCFTGLI